MGLLPVGVPFVLAQEGHEVSVQSGKEKAPPANSAFNFFQNLFAPRGQNKPAEPSPSPIAAPSPQPQKLPDPIANLKPEQRQRLEQIRQAGNNLSGLVTGDFNLDKEADHRVHQGIDVDRKDNLASLLTKGKVEVIDIHRDGKKGGESQEDGIKGTFGYTRLGNSVVLYNPDCNCSISVSHLDKIYEAVKVGTVINPGQVFGKEGNTGVPDENPHLHIQMTAGRGIPGSPNHNYMDPVEYLPAFMKGKRLDEYQGPHVQGVIVPDPDGKLVIWGDKPVPTTIEARPPEAVPQPAEPDKNQENLRSVENTQTNAGGEASGSSNNKQLGANLGGGNTSGQPQGPWGNTHGPAYSDPNVDPNPVVSEPIEEPSKDSKKDPAPPEHRGTPPVTSLKPPASEIKQPVPDPIVAPGPEKNPKASVVLPPVQTAPADPAPDPIGIRPTPIEPTPILPTPIEPTPITPGQFNEGIKLPEVKIPEIKFPVDDLKPPDNPQPDLNLGPNIIESIGELMGNIMGEVERAARVENLQFESKNSREQAKFFQKMHEDAVARGTGHLSHADQEAQKLLARAERAEAELRSLGAEMPGEFPSPGGSPIDSSSLDRIENAKNELVQKMIERYGSGDSSAMDPDLLNVLTPEQRQMMERYGSLEEALLDPDLQKTFSPEQLNKMMERYGTIDESKLDPDLPIPGESALDPDLLRQKQQVEPNLPPEPGVGLPDPNELGKALGNLTNPADPGQNTNPANGGSLGEMIGRIFGTGGGEGQGVGPIGGNSRRNQLAGDLGSSHLNVANQGPDPSQAPKFDEPNPVLPEPASVPEPITGLEDLNSIGDLFAPGIAASTLAPPLLGGQLTESSEAKMVAEPKADESIAAESLPSTERKSPAPPIENYDPDLAGPMRSPSKGDRDLVDVLPFLIELPPPNETGETVKRGWRRSDLAGDPYNNPRFIKPGEQPRSEPVAVREPEAVVLEPFGSLPDPREIPIEEFTPFVGTVVGRDGRLHDIPTSPELPKDAIPADLSEPVES